MSAPRMPKPKNNVAPGDVRSIRRILSDVCLLTLAASGRVTVPTVELTDAFARVLQWRARVVGGLTSQLLDVTALSLPLDARNDDETGTPT